MVGPLDETENSQRRSQVSYTLYTSADNDGVEVVTNNLRDVTVTPRDKIVTLVDHQHSLSSAQEQDRHLIPDTVKLYTSDVGEIHENTIQHWEAKTYS